MIFRDYRPDDYAELFNFWEELGLGGTERGDTPEVIERTLQQGGKLLILEEQGRIIGSSWMTFDGRRTFLHHFGISKSWQGKGLGNKLAEESLKFIKVIGAQVKLEVHKENSVAKHIYEKAGFFAFTDYDIYMIRKVNDN